MCRKCQSAAANSGWCEGGDLGPSGSHGSTGKDRALSAYDGSDADAGTITAASWIRYPSDFRIGSSSVLSWPEGVVDGVLVAGGGARAVARRGGSAASSSSLSAHFRHDLAVISGASISREWCARNGQPGREPALPFRCMEVVRDRFPSYKRHTSRIRAMHRGCKERRSGASSTARENAALTHARREISAHVLSKVPENRQE
jgi:hypothetical protein